MNAKPPAVRPLLPRSQSPAAGLLPGTTPPGTAPRRRPWASLGLALFLLCVACTGGGGSSTTTNTTGGGGGTSGGGGTGGGGGGTGGGGGGTGGGGGAATSFVSTYFADATRSLAIGGSVTERFTLSQPTTFAFRFTSDYQAQAAIFLPSQLSAFTSNQGFSGFGLFDRTLGTHTVSLAAGTYYAGIRNSSAAVNSVRYELDRQTELPSWRFAATVISTADSIAPGARRWHGFTLQAGSRYWIDGCNSGADMFLIDAAQLSNFQNNQTFLQHSRFGGANSPDQYGGIELDLAPGSYYLVQRNPSSTPKGLTYTMERWIPDATITTTPQAILSKPETCSTADAHPDRSALRTVAAGCSKRPLGVTAEWHLDQGALQVGLEHAEPGVPAVLAIGATAPISVPDLEGTCGLLVREVGITTVTDAAGNAVVTLPNSSDAVGRLVQWSTYAPDDSLEPSGWIHSDTVELLSPAPASGPATPGSRHDEDRAAIGTPTGMSWSVGLGGPGHQ